MIRNAFIIAAMLIAATTGIEAVAQTGDAYESGHGALQVFDGTGMGAMPLWIKAWLGILVLTFASSLFFVWRHVEARLALAGFLLSILATTFIFGALDLPFLSGSIAIGHILFWTPALIVLLMRRPFLDASQGRWFKTWSGMMTAVILFSFIFDIRDAVTYLMHVAA